jgi:hypothetical protein
MSWSPIYVPSEYRELIEVFWVVTSSSVALEYRRFRGPCYLRLQVEVYWVVMPWSVMAKQQLFRGPCCLHLHSEDLTTTLHDVTTQKTSTWNITAVKASKLSNRIGFIKVTYLKISRYFYCWKPTNNYRCKNLLCSMESADNFFYNIK